MAKYFPNALPPTVSAATRLVKTIFNIIWVDELGDCCINRVISIMTIVSALPLIIPEISPITSLQKLANLSAFRYIFTASFAPITFSEAIAWSGASLAAVAAIPNISKTIPIRTMKRTIISPIIHVTLLSNVEDKLEKIAANTNVITAIVTLNLIDRFTLSFMDKILPYEYVERNGHLKG